MLKSPWLLLPLLVLVACSSDDKGPSKPPVDEDPVLFDVRDGVWETTLTTRTLGNVQSTFCSDLLADFVTTPWTPVDTTEVETYEESVCEITEDDLALGLFASLGCNPVVTDSTYNLDCTTNLNVSGCLLTLRITVAITGTDTTSTVTTRLQISGNNATTCGGVGLLCSEESTAISRWVRAGTCVESARPELPAAAALRQLGVF